MRIPKILYAFPVWAVVLAFLWGCSPTKPTPPPDTARIVFAPIIPSLDDQLTDGTAQQILIHNCVGYRLGYWDSPGMKEACNF
jgi:hypothetical protein